MPSVNSLCIWLASCADHRRLGEEWLGNDFSGIFVEPPVGQSIIQDTFPGGITHLWISSGTPISHADLLKSTLGKERNNVCYSYHNATLPRIDSVEQLSCSCKNGYTISLASTLDFLCRWQFGMLDELHICDVQVVDVDVAQALRALQQKATDVIFSEEAVGCDVPDSVVDAKLDADAIFEALK